MSKAISYTVQPKDTLARIATNAGKSVTELMKINHITNPNRLEVGQLIYLDKYYANSVQVMLMDVLRHPIEGLKTLLKFKGQIVFTGRERPIKVRYRSPFAVSTR